MGDRDRLEELKAADKVGEPPYQAMICPILLQKDLWEWAYQEIEELREEIERLRYGD
jgi:hypothetical protein